MKAVENDDEWYESWLHTPIYPPRTDSSDAAMKMAGCYVISHKKKDGQPWPMFWGRVVSFDADKDEVKVASTDNYHREGHPKTVWIGTVSQYFQMWRID